VLRVFVAFAWMIGLAVSAAGQSGGKIDVTGDWEFTVETSEGSGDPSFSFKQDGEKLTGRYKGLFGEADLTGTVKGDKIDVLVQSQRPDRRRHHVYRNDGRKDHDREGRSGGRCGRHVHGKEERRIVDWRLQIADWLIGD
jgi:hypothetical protein